MRFELTTPVFEQAKIVHALDRAATVIGLYLISCTYAQGTQNSGGTNGPRNILRNRLIYCSVHSRCYVTTAR
jgi:hypothetical protein